MRPVRNIDQRRRRGPDGAQEVRQDPDRVAAGDQLLVREQVRGGVFDVGFEAGVAAERVDPRSGCGTGRFGHPRTGGDECPDVVADAFAGRHGNPHRVEEELPVVDLGGSWERVVGELLDDDHVVLVGEHARQRDLGFHLEHLHPQDGVSVVQGCQDG